jgi:DNA polymerase elongation subunit (family B)
VNDYKLSKLEDVKELLYCLENGELEIRSHKFINAMCYITLTNDDRVILFKEMGEHWPKIEKYCPEHRNNDLIHGAEKTSKIVSMETDDTNLYLYIEDSPGKRRREVRPLTRWILSSIKPKNGYKTLEGDQDFKYIREFNNLADYKKALGFTFSNRSEFFNPRDDREHPMLKEGYTYFKDMKVSDVSILSLDIETNGLDPEVQDGYVFMISTTYKAGDLVEKKLFSLEDYGGNEGDMIDSFGCYVCSKDPSVLVGHNLVGFDLSFLHKRSQYVGFFGLQIGADGSNIEFAEKPIKIRYDGNTQYDYYPARVHGREIVDTWVLSIKYDVGRDFPSYGLKPIIKHLGYEKEGRIKWNFEQDKPIDIWEGVCNNNASDILQWARFKEYCKDDADDALKLYELMIPSFFYLTGYIPKPFQTVLETNSGGWINSFMIRSYLQINHSIPKADSADSIGGGISHGVPGVYSNVLKFDAKSYYPSTILTFDIYPKRKDPKKHFYNMVEYFTHRRFDQKKKFKETNDKYYDDLQAASKIFINSCYGALNTVGVNFNSYDDARLITQCCRKGLQKAVEWATGKELTYWFPAYAEEKKKAKTGEMELSKSYSEDFEDYSYVDQKCKISYQDMEKRDYKLVNIDTDAISFTKNDESVFTEEEKENIHEYLNNIMYCEWEDDGEYSRFCVIKAKNYATVCKNTGKLNIKGGSILDSKKEPALQEMMKEVIDALLDNTDVMSIYHKYVKEAANIQDISRWCVKRTVSSKVLNSDRTNEQKIFDAIRDIDYREGDKVYLYQVIDGQKQKVDKGELVFLKSGEPKMIDNCVLRLKEKFDGSYDLWHYIERVFKTMEIFDTVIDMDKIVNYSLKKNRQLVEDKNAPNID